MEKLITILLPCLNEEKTLDKCLKLIKKTMNKSKYKKQYTILVCDNGSTDDSIKICKKNKVKYTICNKRGYGNTLLNGIINSNSKYLVMLDADLSYDEKDIPKLIDTLEDGYDLVMGNRFKGTIEKEAMPLSHSIGSRMLTEYANILFHTKSHDYHCGLRAFRRDKILKCNLNSPGFEFASEMIIKAKINKLKIIEIPTNLFKDGRYRPPYLKTIRDGIRHFKLITKIKFNNSYIFRYLSTFILMVCFFFLSSFLSSLIPHRYITKNSTKSVLQLNEIFKKKHNVYNKYEEEGDIKNIAMIYTEDEKHPLKSMVSMNYPIECNFIDYCILGLDESKHELVNYSRYWHGQTTLLKPLLVFFNIKTINIIMMVIFAALYLYTLIRLYRTDRLFTIAFFLASLSINIFFVPKSFQYLPVFIIMLVSLNVIRVLEKRNSKYIDIFFFVTGMITCYYDFLTVETITLTVPLLYLLYFKNKEKEDVNFKTILKYLLLWIIGYLGTFLMKWIIDIIYFGPSIFKEIMHDASIRTWNSRDIVEDLHFSIINNFVPIIPFVYINNGHLILLLLVVVGLLYDSVINKNFFKMDFIALIPIIRYLVLTFHSAHLYFFTYRALFPIIILVLLIFYDIINLVKIKDGRDEKKKFNN